MNNFKITCYNTRRGFFSDLVHGILPSIIYLQDKGHENYNVDWINRLYQSTEFNLYNHFFQNKNFESYDSIMNMSNCPYGIFFSLHNTHKQLERGYECIKNMDLLNSPFINQIKPPFDKSKKILVFSKDILTMEI